MTRLGGPRVWFNTLLLLSWNSYFLKKGLALGLSNSVASLTSKSLKIGHAPNLGIIRPWAEQNLSVFYLPDAVRLCAHHSTIPGAFVLRSKRLCSRPSKMLCSQLSTVHESEPDIRLQGSLLPPLAPWTGLKPPQAASLCHYAECASRFSSKIYTHFSDWLWLPKNQNPEDSARSFLLYDPGLPSGPGLERKC